MKELELKKLKQRFKKLKKVSKTDKKKIENANSSGDLVSIMKKYKNLEKELRAAGASMREIGLVKGFVTQMRKAMMELRLKENQKKLNEYHDKQEEKTEEAIDKIEEDIERVRKLEMEFEKRCDEIEAELEEAHDAFEDDQEKLKKMMEEQMQDLEPEEEKEEKPEESEKMENKIENLKNRDEDLPNEEKLDSNLEDGLENTPNKNVPRPTINGAVADTLVKEEEFPKNKEGFMEKVEKHLNKRFDDLIEKMRPKPGEKVDKKKEKEKEKGILDLESYRDKMLEKLRGLGDSKLDNLWEKAKGLLNFAEGEKMDMKGGMKERFGKMKDLFSDKEMKSLESFLGSQDKMDAQDKKGLTNSRSDPSSSVKSLKMSGADKP